MRDIAGKVMPLFTSSLPLSSSLIYRRRPRYLPKWLLCIRPRPSEEPAATVATTACCMISLATALHDSHQILVEELAFATESQGSIYYGGDWLAAKEAMEICVARHQQLLDIPSYSHLIPNHWPDTLARLQEQLDSLPLPVFV